MLQTSHLVHAPRPTVTAIQRAFVRLDAIMTQCSELDIDKDGKLFESLHEKARQLADKIIRMPAKKPGDMLLKIAAAGALMDRQSDREPLAIWQFLPSGFECDDAGGVLAMSLRDDLNQLLEGI